jgi:hypothetical protein
MLDGSIRSTAEVEDEMMAAVTKAFEKSGIKIPATNEAGQELSNFPKTAPDPTTGALTFLISATRIGGLNKASTATSTRRVRASE